MTAAAEAVGAELECDRQQAEAFIVALADSVDAPCCFQTFWDDKTTPKPKSDPLARVLSGTLAQHWDTLVNLNRHGAGVFITVNETDGAGRKRENITGVRAVFVELDHSEARPVTPRLEAVHERLPLSMVVHSSKANRHAYWLIDDVDKSPAKWEPLQRAMPAAVDAEPESKDLSRVLRLPGFYHLKDPANPWLVQVAVADTTPCYNYAEIEEAFFPDGLPQTQQRQQQQGAPKDECDDTLTADWPRLATAMRYVPNSAEHDRAHFIKMGHALKNAAGRAHAVEAEALFIEWAAKWGDQDDDAAQAWSGFLMGATGAAGAGTIFAVARAAGWDGKADPALVFEAVKPLIDQAVAALAADAGAVYTPDVLQALRQLQQENPREWARVRDRIKATRRVVMRDLEKAMASEDADSDDGQATVADHLVALARERCDMLHDADGAAYAVVRGSPEQVYAVRSSGFRTWLRGAHYEAAQRGIAETTMQTALATIEAAAAHDGALATVHRRCAQADGKLYIDLCDEQWRVVEISVVGVRVLDQSPVRFVRSRGMRPLPLPQVADLDFAPLWDVVNVQPEDRTMLLAALVECLRPDTPHLVLEMVGSQGSAKSATQRVLRDLVDPNDTPLRGKPRDVESIYVAASNGYLVSLENISHLQDEMQDALCVLTTGGGFGKRQHYSDGDEVVLKGKAPVMLNGISVSVTRPDLIDRAVHLSLPRIPEEQRRTDDQQRQVWEQAYPQMFGSLLLLASRALVELPRVHLPKLPRMADFALLGVAAARALGLKDGAFLDRYLLNISDGALRALESSPAGRLLVEFMEGKTEWSGMVGDLFTALRGMATWSAREDALPRTPKALADALRRVLPALHIHGITVEFGKRGMHGYPVKIRRAE